MLNVESYLADLSHKKGAFLLLVDLLHRLNKPDLNYSSAKAEHIQLTTLAQFIVASGDLKIRNKIDSLRTTEIEENIKYVWISPYTCLTFLEYLISKYHPEIFEDGIFNFEEADKQKKEILTSKEAVVFVKAYITLSQTRTDKLLTDCSQEFNDFILNQVTDRIGTYEYEGFEPGYIYCIEVLKSIEFFEFINDKYKDVLNRFLKSRKLVQWEEYSLKLGGIMKLFMGDQNRVRITSGIEKEVDLSLLKRFVTADIFLSEHVNFLNLKKNPLIAYDDNGILSIFQNFTFEKIYKTLYFDIIQEAEELGVSLGKTKLGKEFFEEWLCTKYVNMSFNGHKSINIQETNEAFNKVIERPDHYIRNWNDVFVFEYKDTLIADKAKISHDREVVLSEIKEKLYQKVARRKKPKKSAVLQLAEFIINYKKNYIHFDPKALPNKVNFFPILVVQDRCLSTPGINKILNNLFIETMKNSKANVKYKSLVVINVDTFFLARGILKNIKDFKECLNNYCKTMNDAKENKYKPPMSFESWFKGVYLQNKGKQKTTAYYLYNAAEEAINGLRIAVHGN